MQVLPGSELGQPSSQMDLMPTLVEVGRGKLPKDLLLDGVSMAGGRGKKKAGTTWLQALGRVRYQWYF